MTASPFSFAVQLSPYRTQNMLYQIMRHARIMLHRKQKMDLKTQPVPHRPCGHFKTIEKFVRCTSPELQSIANRLVPFGRSRVEERAGKFFYFSYLTVNKLRQHKWIKNKTLFVFLIKSRMCFLGLFFSLLNFFWKVFFKPWIEKILIWTEKNNVYRFTMQHWPGIILLMIQPQGIRQFLW